TTNVLAWMNKKRKPCFRFLGNNFMYEVEAKNKNGKLLIIFGPPAVGKTSVGKVLESRSNFKLFHNHMVMDSIMHLFGVGTLSEDKLSRIIRENVIKEAAEAGMNLIFTYVWNFAKEKGKTNIDFYKNIYESTGGEVIFIELVAPLSVRAERANNPMRNVEKKYAPNRDRVLALEDSLNFTSPNPFFYSNYTKIDTENKTLEAIAEIILSIIR
ncbi:MAG: hypothetical protein US45_C0046G0011, partial [Candidatus Nomurabacteria bacterium GW2011_GWA1_37_20]